MNLNERSLSTAAMLNAQGTTSRQSDPPQEHVEPSTTLSIFSADYRKHDDLKQMLDSNRDNLKLDAMRRIIGMIAKGKDAAELFPAVVKNVVSKNMEVKKLVYVYLMRYAEEQQDLALLSIATFQRGLKDSNQLIRASALRVLSSIRVPTIVSIMMLAIREAVSDMSPYVRKTAANAIAKLYTLDPELKEQLIVIITKLLADKTVLVNGSAVQAFEHVCPERIDLIHQNYRRLCSLLADIDEWGQVMVVNMLTRYARSQFVDPNKTSDDEDPEENRTVAMDSDHRLLLRCTKALLQSRNAAVVMAVAQLYYYLAPHSDIAIVAKSLIRLLRRHREIQTVVLQCVASMADRHRPIFEPYLKSFFVHSEDQGLIRRYKLEILTVLANATNISTILREFQTYVSNADKEFAAQTIHAIGRCASCIPEVTEACLSGLVALMSKKDEIIVAESVVTIKKLLQINPSQHSDIIKHIVRLVDKVTVPTARASILWLIGEYSERIHRLAPDVLRKMAKTFHEEETIVKHQILNLAAKLYIVNAKQTHLLVQYVFNLAKYDTNYDTRDKARLLRALLLQTDKCPTLARYAKKILLAPKPAPILESIIRDHDQYTLGSLSYVIAQRASGYKELPDFALEPTDARVRHVDSPPSSTFAQNSSKEGKKSAVDEEFYSEEDETSTEGPDTEDDDDDEEPIANNDHPTEYEQLDARSTESLDEEEDEESSESSEEEESSDDERPSPTIAMNEYTIPSIEKSLLDMDLESFLGSTSTAPSVTKGTIFDDLYGLDSPAKATYIRQYDCLNCTNGHGLQIQYRFPRTPFRRAPNRVHVELIMTNTMVDKDIKSIQFAKAKPPMNVEGFDQIDLLSGGSSIVTSIGIDFNDSTQSASFDLTFDGHSSPISVSIPCHVGELLEQKFLTEQSFQQNLALLRGMNELTDRLSINEVSLTNIPIQVFQCANLASVPSSSVDTAVFRFSGQTISSKALVLLTVDWSASQSTLTLTLNSDRIVLGTMLLKEMKEVFSSYLIE